MKIFFLYEQKLKFRYFTKIKDRYFKFYGRKNDSLHRN